MNVLNTRRSSAVALLVGLAILTGCSTDSATDQGSSEPDDVAVTKTVNSYMTKVYREGDAESAIPLTCGYMKQLTYNFVNTPSSDYKSDEPFKVYDPTIVDTPKQMPKASVRVSQILDGSETSAYLTLLKEDGVWKVCDQTARDRLKGGM